VIVRSEPTIVVHVLAEAEHRLAAIHLAHDRFTEAVASASFLGVAESAPALAAAVDDLMATARRVVAEITACDRALVGDDVESVDELAVRAGTIAISRELEHLRFALGDDEPRERARPLFSGDLGTMSAVVGRVRRRLAEINAAWIRYRRSAPDHEATIVDSAGADQDDRAEIERERRVLYRSAVRDARCAMMGIGHDPDLAHFLRAGSGCVDWPEVQIPCANIAKLVGLPPQGEPAGEPASTGAPVAIPWEPSGRSLRDPSFTEESP
jgi:hypothetical protein